MSEIVLAVQDLTKTYTTFRKNPGMRGAIRSIFHRDIIPVHAVKPTTFAIERGSFVGLLGPNGAGKTTILKMLTGLIAPTSGSAVAFQKFDTRHRERAYLKRIGMVMGQRNQLHPDLPAIDSFRLSQAIYDIDDLRFARRLEACLNLFQIHDKATVPVRKLSLGERMKMELILAILHEPELLYLDEPTIGLDFNAAKQIRGFLADANRQLGITIVLTSHYIKDIEELCKRVILINHGTITYDGPLSQLDARIQGERVVSITLNSTDACQNLRRWTAQNLSAKVSLLNTEDPIKLSFAVPTRMIAEILRDFAPVLSVESVLDILIEERGLEEVFSEIFAREASRT